MNYNILNIKKIPSDWEMVRLGDVVDFQGGSQPPKSVFTTTEAKNVIRLIQIRDFKTDKFKTYIPKKEAKRFFNDDDVMIARYGPPVFQILRGLSGSYNVALMKANPTDAVDKNFLFYLLQIPSLHDTVVLNSQRTAGQTGVNLNLLNNFEIPLPPLDNQKKIATVLDKADKLRQKRKETIEKLDQLTQSVFFNMFGDPVTNLKGWDVSNLEEGIDFITSGSRGWAKYYTDEGNKFIRIQNVKNGVLNFNDIQNVTPPDSAEAKRTRVKVNDLLITITADLGRTAVVDKTTADDKAFINQHIALIRLKDNFNPRFVSAFLESSGGRIQFERLDQKGVKSGLNFNSIKSLKILNPPMNLQIEYLKKIQKIEKLKTSQNGGLEKISNLFNSLLQQAFKGELKFNDKVFKELKEEVMN